MNRTRQLFKCFVPIRPVSKSNDNNIGNGRFFRSRRVTEWERDAAEIMRAERRHETLTEKLYAVVEVYHEPRQHAMDLDNALKAPFDALQKAEVIKNDSQIVALQAFKVKAEGDAVPGVGVVLYSVGGDK